MIIFNYPSILKYPVRNGGIFFVCESLCLICRQCCDTINISTIARYIDVRIGNKDYSVEVVTGISNNNEEIAYDIVNINPTQIKRRNTPVGASKSSKNMGNISSNNTITQISNNNNSKNASGNNLHKQQQNSGSASTSQGKFSRKVKSKNNYKIKQFDILQKSNPMHDEAAQEDEGAQEQQQEQQEEKPAEAI